MGAVRASPDAALLTTLLGIITETLPLNASRSSTSAACGGLCRRESAIELLADLAAFSIHPDIVRRLLGLSCFTADPVFLSELCSAIAQRASTEAFLGAAPGRYFCFRGAASSSPLPPLNGPYFGRDAFSIWL